MGRIGAALLVVVATVPATESAEIVGLVSVVRGGMLHVSFEVEEAFSEEIERAIETGLEVSFRYNVELRRERGIWFDASIAKREIRTTVSYDNLTKRYSLTREIDGEIDQTAVVADADAMRRFMTTFNALPLFEASVMEPNEEYQLRVRGTMRDRNLLLLIPWDVSTGWRETTFTYLP